MVLIGVIAEILLEFRSLEGLLPRKWREFTKHTAALILTVGIAGELLGEAKTLSLGGQIEGFLNEKAGNAVKEAGNAAVAAGIANAAAGTANERAAQLEDDVTKENVKIATAQSVAATATRDASEANERAARIEQLAAWRELSRGSRTS